MTDRDGKSKTASAVDAEHYPEKHEVDRETGQFASANEAEIAELAHQLWIGRGRPHGSAEQDWLEAERELRARKTSATTRQPEDSGTVQHESVGAIRR